jgi:hypothetical protein
MNKNFINVLLLVVGVVLLVLGFYEYGTLGEKAGRILGDGVSGKVLFYFIAGVVLTAFGLMNTLRSR